MEIFFIKGSKNVKKEKANKDHFSFLSSPLKNRILFSSLFAYLICSYSREKEERERKEKEKKRDRKKERMFHHPKKPSSMTSNERTSSMCVQNDSGLVLTTDPKPRLRWTVELHERFVDAVTQLGGPDSTYSLLSN